MKVVKDQPKSYADLRCHELNFKVDDLMFLKVSSSKGNMRFRKKEKFSPRYLGSFPILERVGEVDYELTLPLHLSIVHPVFHIFMLKR